MNVLNNGGGEEEGDQKNIEERNRSKRKLTKTN